MLGEILLILWRLHQPFPFRYSLKLVAVSEVVQDFINLLLACFLLPRRAAPELWGLAVQLGWRLGPSFAVLLNLGGKIFGIGFHCAIF